MKSVLHLNLVYLLLKLQRFSIDRVGYSASGGRGGGGIHAFSLHVLSSVVSS